MSHVIERGIVRGFGPVEKILVDGRWVGMVYRDPCPRSGLDERWIAYTQGAQSTDSREDAIQRVVHHAAHSPGFQLD